MSRKNHIKNFKIFDAVDIATNQTSEKTNVEPVDQGTINVSWIGTAPVGLLTVEACNCSDVEINQGNAIWIELDFGAIIPISGNTGEHQIIFDSMPFRYIKLIYTASSGTGSLIAQFHAKSLGA